jgi:hypothetical protein
MEASYVGAHEVGHVLGFNHEHRRPENEDERLCNTFEDDTVPGDLLATRYDPESLMNYCRADRTYETTHKDRAGVQAVYGFQRTAQYGNALGCAPLFTGAYQAGDFNGDGRADLLCAQRDEQGRELVVVDHTDSAGRFGSVDQRASVPGCGVSEARLLADADGDGRTDLLCRTSNSLTVALASPQGTFGGSVTLANFCVSADSRARRATTAGDFDGDGRGDVACLDATPSGADTVQVHLARPNGSYSRAADGEYELTGCGGEWLAGDVNGDGRADLVCVSSGERRTASVCRAGLDGVFSGCVRDAIPCTTTREGAERVRLMDLNADGRQDILCQHPVSGFIRGDLASASGRFGVADWQGPFARWCSTSEGRFGELLVGNVNGDDWDDFLCVTQDAVRVQRNSLRF